MYDVQHVSLSTILIDSFALPPINHYQLSSLTQPLELCKVNMDNVWANILLSLYPGSMSRTGGRKTRQVKLSCGIFYLGLGLVIIKLNFN